MSNRSLWAMVGLGVIAACKGDGGGGGGVIVEPSHFTITLSVSPTDVSIPAGTDKSLAISITRGGNYQGVVSFGVEGLPSYVTASFQPQQLVGLATQSTLTLTVDQYAAAGAYPIVIRASGDSVTEQRVTVNCSLVLKPSFTLTPSAATIAVPQSGSNQLTIGVSRFAGFTGPVNLTLTGAPAGLTATFAPNPVAGDQSTLTLAAAANTPTGTYPVVIHGTGTGVDEHTAALTLTVAAASSYTLSLSPATLSLLPPATGTVSVAIERFGGFAGAVALFAEGFPTGTSVAFTPSPTTGNSSTLSITTTLTAAAGTYNLTVVGQAAGLPDQRVPLQLTIQPLVGYLLRISNPQLTLTAGGTAQTSNVSIERGGGFTGAVTLSATGLPAGVSATFSPASTTGNVSVLSVSAAAGMAPGTYTGTVTGTAAGLADRTTTISVTVVVAGTNIVWRFCSTAPAPVFFAYQDGTSPYTAVSPASDGSYSLSLASGRGAVIFVLPSYPDTTAAMRAGVARVPTYGTRITRARMNRGGAVRALAQQMGTGYTTYVQYGTTAELQWFAQPACGAPGTKTLSGSVANLGSNGFGVGLASAFYFGMPGQTSFTLTGVADGTHDLIAGRVGITQGAELIMAIPDRLILRRDQNPLNGATLPVLDFASAEAVAPAIAPLSLANTNGASVELSGAFATANGTYTFVHGGDVSTSTNRTYFGVPSPQLRFGDLHWLIAGDEAGRTAVLFAHDVTSRTLTMGPTIATPVVSVYATTPVVRMRAVLTLGLPDTEYGGSFETVFLQPGSQRAFVMAYARGAIGSSTSIEIRTPVLTGLPGWDESRYGFILGSIVNWQATQWSMADTYVPVDGGSIRYVNFAGQAMP